MVGTQQRAWLQIFSSQTSATEQRKAVTHVDQGKENQHAGGRPREYTVKEKRVRRLFFW